MNPALFKAGLKLPPRERIHPWGRVISFRAHRYLSRVSNRMHRIFLALIQNKPAGKVWKYLSSSLIAKHSRDLRREGLAMGFSGRKHQVNKQKGF